MPVSLHKASSACEVDALGASSQHADPSQFVRGRRRSARAELASLPVGHKRTGVPLDGGILGPVPRRATRRVNRSAETSREVVRAAVPKGSLRAAHGNQVTAHLRNLLAVRRMRADGQQNRLRTMAYLIARTDYETMTCRPGWDSIAEAVGCHRRTVARYLAEFEAWGLLGRVAGGRQARYAAPGPDGEKINEAAVYVLCIPSPLALLRGEPKPAVDINATPPALGGSHLKEKNLTHTRACENESPSVVASPRLSIPGAASGAATPPVPWRPEIRWPAHRTTSRKIQRQAAASEIWYRSFALRCLSIKDLASICRDFFLAGWTVADILHALDWQPDGAPWPHSGAPATREPGRIRGWAKNRLAAWRTVEGEPLRSKDQQAAARSAALKREQALERRRLAKERLDRASAVAEGNTRPSWRTLAAQHGYTPATTASRTRENNNSRYHHAIDS